MLIFDAATNLHVKEIMKYWERRHNGENTTTGYVNLLSVTFCDMSQKAIDITGYGPRPCGVLVITVMTRGVERLPSPRIA